MLLLDKLLAAVACFLGVMIFYGVLRVNVMRSNWSLKVKNTIAIWIGIISIIIGILAAILTFIEYGTH